MSGIPGVRKPGWVDCPHSSSLGTTQPKTIQVSGLRPGLRDSGSSWGGHLPAAVAVLFRPAGFSVLASRKPGPPYLTRLHTASNRRLWNIVACFTASSPPNIDQPDEANTPLNHARICLKCSDDAPAQIDQFRTIITRSRLQPQLCRRDWIPPSYRRHQATERS